MLVTEDKMPKFLYVRASTQLVVKGLRQDSDFLFASDF